MLLLLLICIKVDSKYLKIKMDRREFIKNSALATVGGLLLTTPLANISAQTKDKSNKELTNEPYHMRVLLINGSPRKNGNTFAALNEASKRLETHDIETEIVQKNWTMLMPSSLVRPSIMVSLMAPCSRLFNAYSIALAARCKTSQRPQSAYADVVVPQQPSKH